MILKIKYTALSIAEIRQQSIFAAYIMLLISDNYRLHVGQVVIRDKLIIR